MHLVKSNISLEDKSIVSLSYRHHEKQCYYAIFNGGDIKQSIKVINMVGGKILYVFVVVDECVGAN